MTESTLLHAIQVKSKIEELQTVLSVGAFNSPALFSAYWGCNLIPTSEKLKVSEHIRHHVREHIDKLKNELDEL